MGDRIGIINGGVIKQLDTPIALYAKPKDKFVASFIGAPKMNFIECTCQMKDGKTMLVQDSFSLDMTQSQVLTGSDASDRELTLGIRPEDVLLQPSKKSPDCLQGTVYILEPMGSRSLLSAQVGKNLVKVMVRGETDLKPGAEVWLEFKKDKIHLFDSKTSQVIV
jgi:multiple sugar transport system ATP-binding protein